MSNLKEKGLGRLAFQFEQSENLKGLISAQLDSFEELDDTFNDLLSDRLLDKAVGKQLDGLGDILGFPRPFLPIDVSGVFGFLTDPTSKAFGDINNPSSGGNFVGFNGTRQIAGDDTYRTLLKARTVINRSSMTVEETIETLVATYGAKVRYILTTNLSPTYNIEKVLDGSDIALLKTLPILIGLGDVTYISSDTFTPFGFDGDPSALGFTDINNTDLGGNFAQIL